MPEQLTKHPDVTLQVLRSAGARCGVGAPQKILVACPAQRFCALPGGELCIYGLREAGSMTQISPAEWQAVQPVPASSPVPALAPQIGLGLGGVAIMVAAVVAAALLGAAWGRRRR